MHTLQLKKCYVFDHKKTKLKKFKEERKNTKKQKNVLLLLNPWQIGRRQTPDQRINKLLALFIWSLNLKSIVLIAAMLLVDQFF